MVSANARLDYLGMPRPRRVVSILDPVLRRHLLAMLTTLLAAIGMALISYAMLNGIL
jgi:hypothetical protein